MDNWAHISVDVDMTIIVLMHIWTHISVDVDMITIVLDAYLN